MGPPELCGACQRLVGFLELSRNWRGAQNRQMFSAGPRPTQPKTLGGSRGLGRPLLTRPSEGRSHQISTEIRPRLRRVQKGGRRGVPRSLPGARKVSLGVPRKVLGGSQGVPGMPGRWLGKYVPDILEGFRGAPGRGVPGGQGGPRGVPRFNFNLSAPKKRFFAGCPLHQPRRRGGPWNLPAQGPRLFGGVTPPTPPKKPKHPQRCGVLIILGLTP